MTEKSKKNKKVKRFIYDTEQMLKKPEKRDCPKCKGHGTIAVKTTNFYRRERRDCPLCRGTGYSHPNLIEHEIEHRWREAQWRMIQEEEDRLMMKEMEEALKETRKEDS